MSKLTLASSETCTVDYLPTAQKLAFGLKLKGLWDSDFTRLYFRSPYDVQDYLGRHTGKALVALNLGIPRKLIAKAELLPLDDRDSALLSAQLKPLAPGEISPLLNRILELEQKGQNPAEAQRLVNDAFRSLESKRTK